MNRRGPADDRRLCLTARFLRSLAFIVPALFVPLLAALSGLSVLAVPAIARAQDAAQEDLQRQMRQSAAERDRRTQVFALELQQHQAEIQAPPAQRPALQALHAEQRRQFDRLLERQRREESRPSWGPQLELDRLPEQERERRLQLQQAAPALAR